jgi:glycosyltransferase involved in cell wall biosynthesis
MKICVYAICKNEEAFVDRWMDAVSEADQVIVLDTGSTDQTVLRLRERGATVYEAKIDPWRFAVARNLALSYVPEDADICVSNDLDEVFSKGWRKHLEEAWTDTCTRCGYWFVWQHGSDRSIQKRFKQEKIHQRHFFKWVHPVHEVLSYDGTDPDNSIFVPNIYLHHYPDTNKSRGDYLALLKLSVQENPMDDRSWFWLGREYYFHKQYEQAIGTLRHHLTLPSACWDEERSASLRFIAKAYQAMEQPGEATPWLFRAAAECMDVREPWLDLAKDAYNRSDWTLCYFAAEKGMQIQTPKESYLQEVEAWNGKLEDLAAIASYHLGLYQKSEIFAKAALSFHPDDARLQNNLKIIMAKEAEDGESV